MPKLILSDLSSLQNETTAITAINANYALTETAVENTLSRDGTSPNQMGANLDMNSHRILNLPSPVSSLEPLRLTDLDSFINGTATFSNMPTGGTSGQVLTKNSSSNYDASWITPRDRLTADRTYYVRTDGSDSNTGLTNTSGGAFLTFRKCLNLVAYNLDLAGYNVLFRVQGGTYTENLLLPGGYAGYTGNGFQQVRFLGENGTVLLTAGNASATIFSTKAYAPINFENINITNQFANGISVYCDDFGFVALKGCTFSGTGAGGIVMDSVLFSNILLMASTFELTSSSGVLFYARNFGIITTQPGVVFNAAGVTAYSAGVANIGVTSAFLNGSSSFTGTVPTGPPFVIESGGYITDKTLIAGSTTPVYGLYRVESFTVANLPVASRAAGDIAFASNCRVFDGAGTLEGAGVGTGSLVVYNGTSWKIVGTNRSAVA